jgi:hypothetical protein
MRSHVAILFKLVSQSAIYLKMWRIFWMIAGPVVWLHGFLQVVACLVILVKTGPVNLPVAVPSTEPGANIGLRKWLLVANWWRCLFVLCMNELLNLRIGFANQCAQTGECFACMCRWLA